MKNAYLHNGKRVYGRVANESENYRGDPSKEITEAYYNGLKVKCYESDKTVILITELRYIRIHKEYKGAVLDFKTKPFLIFTEELHSYERADDVAKALAVLVVRGEIDQDQASKRLRAIRQERLFPDAAPPSVTVVKNQIWQAVRKERRAANKKRHEETDEEIERLLSPYKDCKLPELVEIPHTSDITIADVKADPTLAYLFI